MGKRQKTLEQLFRDAGYPIGIRKLPRPSVRARGAGPKSMWAEVERVYKQLDGALAACPLQTGQWDMEIGDVAVELDEEQHFNRYRLITLESTLYSAQSSFPLGDYQSHCKLYERECLSKAANRGYWSSDSTIKQFGPASPLGDLRPPGAPRWKQRAFYDFLKDLAPEITGTSVARISIWETVEVNKCPVRVCDILDRSMQVAVPILAELIGGRAGARLTF